MHSFPLLLWVISACTNLKGRFPKWLQRYCRNTLFSRLKSVTPPRKFLEPFSTYFQWSFSRVNYTFRCSWPPLRHRFLPFKKTHSKVGFSVIRPQVFQVPTDDPPLHHLLLVYAELQLQSLPHAWRLWNTVSIVPCRSWNRRSFLSNMLISESLFRCMYRWRPHNIKWTDAGGQRVPSTFRTSITNNDNHLFNSSALQLSKTSSWYSSSQRLFCSHIHTLKVSIAQRSFSSVVFGTTPFEDLLASSSQTISNLFCRDFSFSERTWYDSEVLPYQRATSATSSVVANLN